MEKNNKTKRVFILLVTYFVIIFTSKSCNDNHRYKPQITYNQEYTQDSPLPYATYSNGNVYIANEEIISDIITDGNDIYIIDQRDSSDPNFRIDSSYRITSERQRNEIIKILLNYESEYPSAWDREEESLRNKTKKGLFWSALERFGTQGISALFAIFLARINLIISYVTIIIAGINIAINHPVLDARKNCNLPSLGILNITFPIILFGNTFSSSALSLASPFTLNIVPLLGTSNISTILWVIGVPPKNELVE